MRDHIGRRHQIDRRTWSGALLAVLFAPVLLGRRRGERRDGFDRRRRVAPAYQ
jgi:hypothetical protein